MTRNKDLKRLVRARMRKTGEAYTTARATLLRKAPQPAAHAASARTNAPLAGARTATTTDFGRIAGMSDTAVRAKTGCGWEEWVKALDHHGAQNMTHAEIAMLIRRTYKTPSWWSQTVAVGYERIRGLRESGQQRDGSYRATRSRTFPVPVEALFDAWSDATVRRRWLGTTVRVRTATKPKSMRLDWPDGTILAVGFTAKPGGRSAAAVEQVKLRSRAAVLRVKEEWSERFDALARLLSMPAA